MGSLKSQAVYCLNALKAFGASRHRTRRNGTAPDLIHSIGTMQTYCDSAVCVLEWCQEHYGLRRAADLTPSMVKAFIAQLRARRCSPATVSVYVCALRKLDTGLRKVGWRRRNAEPLVQDYHGRHADVVADPYSPEDAERLIAALMDLDPQFAQVARLQRISGLRVSEAVHLQAHCIAPDGSQITLSGPGIHTKGGRERIVPILEQHRSALIELREQGLAHADGHVLQHRQSLTNAVKRAASALATKLGIEIGDGSHSFRKCYSNELYQHLVTASGLSPDEARRAVTQALGHNRLEVLRAYLVEDTESED